MDSMTQSAFAGLIAALVATTIFRFSKVRSPMVGQSSRREIHSWLIG